LTPGTAAAGWPLKRCCPRSLLCVLRHVRMATAAAKAASVVGRIKKTLQNLHQDQMDVFSTMAEEHIIWLREIIPEVKRGLTE